MAAEIIIRADFAGASEDALHQVFYGIVIPYRRRPAYFSDHFEKVPSPTTALQVEMLVCVDFVERANAIAQESAVDILWSALRAHVTRSTPSRRELSSYYASTVGTYFEIVDFVQGSCTCPVEKRPERVRVFVLAALMAIGGEAFKNSEVGGAIISEVTSAIDDSTDFTERVLRAAGDRFPTAVQFEYEEAQCRITLCLDPPRQP